MSKKWWQSKTMWVNIAAIVVAVQQLLTDLPSDVVPGWLLASVAGLLAVVNIILRLVTSKPISRGD